MFLNLAIIDHQVVFLNKQTITKVVIRILILEEPLILINSKILTLYKYYSLYRDEHENDISKINSILLNGVTGSGGSGYQQ